MARPGLQSPSGPRVYRGNAPEREKLHDRRDPCLVRFAFEGGGIAPTDQQQRFDEPLQFMADFQDLAQRRAGLFCHLSRAALDSLEAGRPGRGRERAARPAPLLRPGVHGRAHERER